MQATKIRVENDQGRWVGNKITCACGAVETVRGDFHCDACGRIYNLFGQQLDWQAVNGCAHYRMGADCDCGAEE